MREKAWWRETSDVGAVALEATLGAARRGVDVRVVMRNPAGPGVRNRDAALATVDQLRRALALTPDRIRFDPRTHRKEVIGDGTLITSSMNLTETDDWQGNAGVLITDPVSVEDAAAAMWPAG